MFKFIKAFKQSIPEETILPDLPLPELFDLIDALTLLSISIDLIVLMVNT